MHTKWIVTVGAAFATCAAALAAQQPPVAPAPPTPPTPPPAAVLAPRARAWAYSVTENRGRLGVLVGTDASADTDKLGARVEGVTPGGPADRAGLKVGDVITKFNDTALGGAPTEDADESGPGHKLIELARKLEPGDTVRLEYRRGNAARKATLVAADLGFAFNFSMPRMPEFRMEPMDGVRWCMGDEWCDLDLVSLNPDLGEYFGTKEGLLVVKAPGDSSLPLKGGDVILAIGGRKPQSPSHAMRILRSYDQGETVSIEIMRRQKRLTLTWTVPRAREEPLGRHSEREEQSALRRRLLQAVRRGRAQRV